MKEKLLETIRRVTDLPREEEEKICRIVQSATFKKGDRLVEAGVVPRKFGFVCKGLFRYYYLSEKGSEFTKGFHPEGTFISSYTAMVKQSPSYYTIEALEASEVLVIDYDDWHKLFVGHPCWTNFLLAQLQKGFMKKEARERELLLLNAEERYEIFLHEYPHLEKRIKQHMIASYLGITPVALSRIRTQMQDASDKL
jgi:CRP-like cAMP-binding protein